MLSRADNLMARLLLVNSGVASVAVGDEETIKRGAENALTLSLMFSGARCIIQYALLPFPVAGHRDCGGRYACRYCC